MEDLSLTRSLLSPSEALELSLFLRGRVDLHLICERTGLSSAEVYDKLVGFVYYDPDQDALVSSSEYLSGNVLKKLNRAKKFQHIRL